MLQICIKRFPELTTNELHDVLQLRNEVFVVEQNCIYQDVDGKDINAFHLLGLKADNVVAYTRIFKAGDYFKNASIGRVVVAKEERKHGYGHTIMQASIAMIHDTLKENNIHISAQTYLKKFYASLGFKQVGEAYLEDGIPHIGMEKIKRPSKD